MSRKIKGPVLLVVLDGWGLREEQTHNGIALAQTPWFDHIVQKYPFTQLEASGEAVGLPMGQMGNSEVGHTTIGAGCVLYQDLVRISKDVESGDFAKNEAFQQAFSHVQNNKSQLHIMGLLSTGGVHSHEAHFFATIQAAHAVGIRNIVLHVFLDGRDAPKTSGFDSLLRLEALVDHLDGVEIGSISGRYFAMDRDTNWDRIDKSFQAIFHGKAERMYEVSVKPSQIIQEQYHAEIFDEHMEPIVFQNSQGTVLEVRDNDALIFTNFRKDRARQLSQKICEQSEDRNLKYVTMTNYGSDIQATIAYKPEEIQTTLGEVISLAEMKQAHIAETEKFPHATYFLNGGRETAYDGEEDVLVPSRKDVKTHDEAPEMRAREITSEAIKRLEKTDFMFINYANPDIVGHTANEKAIITAIETVDQEIKKLSEAVLKHDGAVLFIADHGNAETMIDPITGEPHTSHTTNPVPCILVSNSFQSELRSDNPGLRDVAPTILDLLGLTIPSSMTGTSLLTKK